MTRHRKSAARGWARWLIGAALAAALAGCGSGDDATVEGSSRLRAGRYSGTEEWTAGVAAGTTIPIVAVVTAGNNFVYSDLNAPGQTPYNGAAILPVAADSDGDFSAAIEEGTFDGGSIPAGTVSGRNTPDSTPQLSGAIALDGGDKATWGLLRQSGSGHALEGLYQGAFSAPESGPVILMVAGDGVAILLRGPANRWVETAVGAADEATGALVFSGLNPDRAVAGVIVGDTASGTYTFDDVGSGTWTATKQ